MNDELVRAFVRVATRTVVRRPAAWRVLRGPIRRVFDDIAPEWDVRRGSAERLAPLEAAVAAIDVAPRRILDLGTGTGIAARKVAERYPDAEVVGVDIAPAMVDEARRKLPPELRTRLRFEVADASRLPFAAGSFELVTLANMIPFFHELARVVAPGGSLVFSYANGEQTPVYVPPERLRAELEPRGFTDFATFRAGNGIALVARRRDA